MTVESRRRLTPAVLVALFALALLAFVAAASRPALATPGFCTQGDEVVSFVQGTNVITDDDEDNTDPNRALGIQDGLFVALGHGGQITIRFGQTVVDGPGRDIEVYDVQGNDGATVEVSQDGTTFVPLGVVAGAQTTQFDLAGSGLSAVNYIRITDDNSGGPDSPSAGLDLDAVEGFNCGDVPANPAIDIEKLTNGEDADSPTGPVVPVGSAVTWTYVVTNTGDVDLVNVVVTDDQGVAVSCPSTTLAVGASMNCTGNGTAEAGQYANIGCVEAEDASGTPVSDCDPSHYFGADPAIDIEKHTNGEDADTPTGPNIPVGSTVTWEYFVTNTGNVDLENVVVTDDQGVAVSCPSTTLAVGASMTCTGNGTAEAGQYANIGCVTAEDASGTGVSDCDPSHYFGEEVSTGGEGCTPGYWKQTQHFDSWVGFTQNQDYETVFGVDASFTRTLLGALEQGGGGEKALGRHAVAALLNSANGGVEYLYSTADVIALVQEAYSSGDFEGVKNLLAAENEEGCPLN